MEQRNNILVAILLLVLMIATPIVIFYFRSYQPPSHEMFYIPKGLNYEPYVRQYSIGGNHGLDLIPAYIDKGLIFKEMDKQTNFLYAKFWEGMSEIEFDVVADSLVKSKSLQEQFPFIYVNLFATKFRIYGKFHHDSLKSVCLNYNGIELNDFKQALGYFSIDSKAADLKLQDRIIELYNTKYGKSEKELKFHLWKTDSTNIEFRFSKNFYLVQYFPSQNYISPLQRLKLHEEKMKKQVEILEAKNSGKLDLKKI